MSPDAEGGLWGQRWQEGASGSSRICENNQEASISLVYEKADARIPFYIKLLKQKSL